MPNFTQKTTTCLGLPRLGVSRRTVAEIVHERRAVTPDMAIRLGHLLGTSANSWLSMQQALDIWNLENQRAADYNAIQRIESGNERQDCHVR